MFKSIYTGNKGLYKTELITVVHHVNNIKMENYMFIPMKAFDRIPHPFMIKHLSKLGVERGFLIPIKGIYEKLRNNITVNAQRLNAAPLRSETK